MKRQLIYFILVPLFMSCSVSKNYNPNKKFAPEELRKDYSLMRSVLEKKHPSIYWYTPKDSMDFFFDEGFKAITDSMTELQFGWKLLAPITSRIHCGHTSFSMSDGWNQFIKNKTIPSFPLHLKVWDDTMMVVENLNPKDAVFKRGYFIKSINGISSKEIIATLFEYMSGDGYADNVNYIRLSSGFPYFHRNVFGLYKQYSIIYTDSNQVEKSALLPFYEPPAKKGKTKIKENRITHQDKMDNIRSLTYDSSFALMTVNGFSRGHLVPFFKKSFRELRKNKTENLVIDLRANGGGDINKSVLLTKFLRHSSFKVADSVYSVQKNLKPYTKYISAGFFNNLGLSFVTHKKKWQLPFWILGAQDLSTQTKKPF